MADERQRIDANFNNVMGAVTNNTDQDIVQLRVNAITKRLLVEQAALTAAVDSVATIEGLSIPAHDYIGLTYTGDNLTGVAYKTGGSGGTTVATLTLAYTGAVLNSVTKT